MALTYEEALRRINRKVKLHPPRGGTTHYGFGTIISVGKRDARIKPNRHGGRCETYPLTALSKYKPGDVEHGIVDEVPAVEYAAQRTLDQLHTGETPEEDLLRRITEGEIEMVAVHVTRDEEPYETLRQEGEEEQRLATEQIESGSTPLPPQNAAGAFTVNAKNAPSAPATLPNGKQRLFLNQVQLFKFWEWMKLNKNTLELERPKYSEVAKRATQSLGFTVHESHVVAGRKATGVTWVTKAAERQEDGMNTRRLTRRNVKALTEFVCKIAQQLGEEIPEAIQAIIDEPDPNDPK
jgi:hypothetical protein